jgi:hypothetical protein
LSSGGRQSRAKGVGQEGRRLQPGDLVLPGERFDDFSLEWVPYAGTGLVIELLTPPLYPGPAHTLVYVLIEGRVVDDYYEDELTLL